MSGTRRVLAASAAAGGGRQAVAAPVWRPLLRGEAAERARDAVLAIAAALREPAALPPSAAGPDLSRGHAGRALFFAYLAPGFAEPGWREEAAAALDAAAEALAERPLGPELLGGFTGVGWVFEHLAGRLDPAAEADDAPTEIDEALATLLAGSWQGDYDLIGGLAGFAVYALETMPRPAARRLLARVVEELRRRAEPRHGGLTWHTPPSLVPPSQLRAAPDGYYNLGPAHGVPGAIVVLARAAAEGVAGAADALEPAAAWLLGRERPESDGRGAFAHWELPRAAADEPRESRLAWCYGDLGVAAALDAAGRAAGEPTWCRAARRVARRAAARPAERSGVVDAGLCHGAAGVGHLFNRLAQASGDDLLADAARRWLLATLALRRPGAGVGGYAAWEAHAGGWRDEAGFLTGAAGVGLALLAAIASEEPEWDRVLAISGGAGGEPGRAA